MRVRLVKGANLEPGARVWSASWHEFRRLTAPRVRMIQRTLPADEFLVLHESRLRRVWATLRRRHP